MPYKDAEKRKQFLKDYYIKHKESTQEARNKKHREYYQKNKEKIAKASKDYYEKNKEKKLKKGKEYYDTNKIKVLDRVQAYAKNHPEIIKKAQKNYCEKNRENLNTKSREYYRTILSKQPNKIKSVNKIQYQKHRAGRLEKAKEYYVKNKEKKLSYSKEYQKEHPEVRRKAVAKFYKTTKGKIQRAKTRNIRRSLGHTSLNTPFKDAHGHHLNKELVVHIPKDLHYSVSHSISTWKNMTEINRLAIRYLIQESSQKELTNDR